MSKGCKDASWGCVDCKKSLVDAIMEELRETREKRIELEKNLDYINEVLETGAKKAREVASNTLDRVRNKTGL